MEKDKVASVVAKLVKELKVPLTRLSIENELLIHPDYPSLFAISEVLSNWKIANAAYKIPFEQLGEVPCPYIACYHDGSFVVVTSFNEKQLTISDHSRNGYIIPAEAFKGFYSEAILAAEAEAECGETDYKVNRRKENADALRTPFILLGLVFIMSALLLNTGYFYVINLPVVWLTLCKTAGIAVTTILLIQSIDDNNPFIQKLCTGKNNDCNAILSSKAAKITQELSWSEIGFFYFAGTWLAILFNSRDTHIMYVLAILNLLCLPYTFYSVYYQSRIAKQWCVFCLSVQALFWLEFIGFLPYITGRVVFPSLAGWLNLAACFIVPVVLWVFVKPFLKYSKQVLPLKQQLQRFKYNVEFFNKELNDKPKYALLDHKHSIILGNPEAEHVITIVSNPLCQPCSKAHKILDEWLEHRDDIKLQVVFAASVAQTDKAKITGHFMAMSYQHNSLFMKTALNDWYNRKIIDYHSLVSYYPVTEDPGIDMVMEIQKQWCDNIEIKGTPTIFINGRQLPHPYQPEDIKYFI
ncbi:hypothetical protein EOD41_13260 [Mucilaginibacter limnophilus]|uniref:Peptidase C39 domain-containing protein n=1 Tax=Mucilaginibacter limnophilus TaxID=1932778 RepID=A0A3S2WXM1_9SPHI|nr:vitamin K epoxide reductase family protein [Mucilaginibacter limnophilus]RVU00440.1 hypothetical protein EOD41_13260 [Mucilaginibacter limnophilus]